MTKRIDGIDFARALALLGMILVNFKVVFGVHIPSESLYSVFYSFLEGKAAALFIFLAGIGITLGYKKLQKDEEIREYKKNLVKRAAVLFVVGIAYYPIWPADILHFYSFYILLGVFLLMSNNMKIILSVITILIISVLLLLTLDYSAGWDFETLEYIDFWSVEGFLRHIIFNGFHPVFPWSCFLLFGLLIGRINLSDFSKRRKVLLVSSIAFIIFYIVSILAESYYSGMNLWEDFASGFLGMTPMPPTVWYIFTATLSSIIITIISIELFEIQFFKRIFSSIQTTGKFALTHYVFHVVIGMTTLYTIFEPKDYVVEVIFPASIIYFIFSVIFSVLWKKYLGSGPFERLLRKVAK